jgi:hypothetical protein
MNPIPGVAGVDYPTFNSVPDTGFDCEKQNFPGIYSDTGAQCQVIHTIKYDYFNYLYTKCNTNQVCII